MPRHASVSLNDTVSNLMFAMRGSVYIVETPEGVLYKLFINNASGLFFTKSSDGGITWGPPVTLFVGTVTQFAVWYDKWSGLAGGLIHYTYVESVTTDDVRYRTINTASSDALSTETVVTALSSATNAGGGTLSITRSRGGIVYVRSCVDAGVEGGFAHLINANVPNGAWASRTIDEAVADNDDIVLMPGFAADSDDILAVFMDASANILSRKIFDASANTWAEANILTLVTEPLPENQSRNFAVTPDLTNNRLFVVCWEQSDVTNADLRCYTVTESAITYVGLIIDSLDDQGMCTISLDPNGLLYCAYGGLSDGSQTFTTAISLYYRVSTDAGATWGAENSLNIPVGSIQGMFCRPRMYTRPFGITYVRFSTDVTTIKYTATIVQPRAAHQMFGG